MGHRNIIEVTFRILGNGETKTPFYLLLGSLTSSFLIGSDHKIDLALNDWLKAKISKVTVVCDWLIAD